MQENAFNNIVIMLSQIEEDSSVPKNIRGKIKSMILMLNDKCIEHEIKCDKSLQGLDDIANDPGMPVYIRTQIWNILSVLESGR